MARVDRRTLRWIREVGLPDGVDEAQIEELAARIREAGAAQAAAELQEWQIGADPRSNVGGEPGTLDGLEDGAPPIIFLEQATD